MTEPASDGAGAGSSRLPSLGPNGEGWVAIQVVLFGLAAVAGWRGLADPAWADPWALGGRVAGALLVLGGGLFALLGVTGLRENLTANPRPRAGGHLVDTGVYGIVRHPIYTGIIVAALGWGLVTASPWALAVAVVLFLFFDTKARREEAWLVAAYRDYPAYRRRVRKLVPFLY